MASSYRESSGAVVVEWGSGRERGRVRFPSMTDKAVREVVGHVEELVQARATGTRPRATTEAWANSLADKVHERLARAGLVSPRAESGEPATLGALLDRVFASLEVRDSTRTTMMQTRAALEGHFGKSRRLDDIKPIDAEDWKSALLTSGLARATVSKRVRQARTFFRQAHRWRMIDENPFDGVRAGAQTNRDRLVYVPAETVERLIEACPPDSELRLVLALARYAAFRCPTEVAALEWSHVVFDADKGDRLIVTATKTSGHDGKGMRHAPIHPRLAALLVEAHSRASEGERFVCPRLRAGSGNVVPQVRRLAARAGVAMWDRTMQALRASCATDWHAAFPAHVAEAWAGHCGAVAKAHYLVATDDMFKRAAASKSGQNPGQHRGNSDGTDRNAPPAAASEPALCGVERSGAEAGMKGPKRQGHDDHGGRPGDQTSGGCVRVWRSWRCASCL